MTVTATSRSSCVRKQAIALPITPPPTITTSAAGRGVFVPVCIPLTSPNQTSKRTPCASGSRLL